MTQGKNPRKGHKISNVIDACLKMSDYSFSLSAEEKENLEFIASELGKNDKLCPFCQGLLVCTVVPSSLNKVYDFVENNKLSSVTEGLEKLIPTNSDHYKITVLPMISEDDSLLHFYITFVFNDGNEISVKLCDFPPIVCKYAYTE